MKKYRIGSYTDFETLEIRYYVQKKSWCGGRWKMIFFCSSLGIAENKLSQLRGWSAWNCVTNVELKSD